VTGVALDLLREAYSTISRCMERMTVCVTSATLDLSQYQAYAATRLSMHRSTVDVISIMSSDVIHIHGHPPRTTPTVTRVRAQAAV